MNRLVFRSNYSRLLYSFVVVTGISYSKQSSFCDAPPSVTFPSQPVECTAHTMNLHSSACITEASTFWVNVQCFNRVCTYLCYLIPGLFLGGLACMFAGVCPLIEDYMWDYVVYAVDQLGPCFVKMSRWLAIKADVLPTGLLSRFQTLHGAGAGAAAASVAEAEIALDASFGPGWRRRLVLERPGTGRLAGSTVRVCKGRLIQRATISSPLGSGAGIARGGSPATLPVGTPITVKIADPIVGDIVRRDAAVAALCSRIAKQYLSLDIRNVVDVIAGFTTQMRAQLDLGVEAANIDRLTSNFSAEVVFPVPLRDLQSREVSVFTELGGETVAEFRRRTGASLGSKVLLDQLADMTVKTVVKMVFSDNFVLCDAFEDNMRVIIDEATQRLRIGFGDCSNCSGLRDEEHEAFRKLCYALAEADGLQVGKHVLSMAHPRGLGLGLRNEGAYCTSMRALVARSEVEAELGELTPAAAERALMDSYDLLNTHGLKLDPTCYLLLNSMLLCLREVQEGHREYDIAGAAIMHMSDVF